MSQHDDQLPSIDTVDLAAVTGGAHRPGHVDAQLTATLTSITDSLKNLGNANKNDSSLSQLLPLMMLARNGGGGCPGAPTIRHEESTHRGFIGVVGVRL